MNEFQQMTDSCDEKKKRNNKDKLTSGKQSLSEVNQNNFVMSVNQRSVRPTCGAGGENAFSLPPIIGPGKRTSLVQGQTQRPTSRDSNRSRKSSLTSSLHSFTDSIWSDEYDTDRTKKVSLRRQHKVATVVSIANTGGSPTLQHTLTSLPSLNPPNKKLASTFNDSGNGDLDDFLTDLDFGLPTVDVNTAHTVPDFDDEQPSNKKLPNSRKPQGFPRKNPGRFPAVTNGNHIYRPVMNLAGSPDFKCQSSCHIR